MKTTIKSTHTDGGFVVVAAIFEFPGGEWSPDEAKAAVEGFKADRNAPMVAALSLMSEEDKRIAKQCGVSPRDFARYNQVKAPAQPRVRFGVGNGY